MALRVWVRHVAPAWRAVRPWAWEAVVWPRETRMEDAVKLEMRDDAPGSSGARVTSLREVEGP